VILGRKFHGEVVMPKHIILICTGLVLGIMANWWIQPDTAAGSTTLIVLAVLLSEGIGALVTLLLRLAFRMRHHGDPPPQSPAKLLAAGLVVVAALHGPARAQSPADPPAPGPTGMVTVLNAAEQALTGVFITKPAGAAHEANLLGGSALGSGQQRQFATDTSHGCGGSVSGVFANGAVTEEQGVDLCTHQTLVLREPRAHAHQASREASPVVGSGAGRSNAGGEDLRGSYREQRGFRFASPPPAAAPQAPAPRAELAARAPVTLAAPPAAAFAPLASLLAAPPAVALAAPPPTALLQASPAPSQAATAGSAPHLHPARVFMAGPDIPPAGVGAYGVVALKSTPTPSDTARLTAACNAFLSHLPPQSDLPATVPLSEQMLTIWPLRPAGQAAAEQGSCPDMLANYQLDAGLSAIADAATGTNHLDGRGPFLIGWSPSNMRGVKDAVVLVVDMSTLDSQASFNDAFLFWQQKIVEDPTLWQHGFSSEKLRLSLRDFVDHYGGSIQDAVKMFVHS
jgi:hypothetical protein